MAASAVIALTGIAIAWWFYVASPGIPAKLAENFRPLYQLSLNKFYLDEMLGWLIVGPARGLAWLSGKFDLSVIDRLVDAIGYIPLLVSRVPVYMHSGLVSSYALVMFTGAVVCVWIAMRWMN